MLGRPCDPKGRASAWRPNTAMDGQQREHKTLSLTIHRLNLPLICNTNVPALVARCNTTSRPHVREPNIKKDKRTRGAPVQPWKGCPEHMMPAPEGPRTIACMHVAPGAQPAAHPLNTPPRPRKTIVYRGAAQGGVVLLLKRANLFHRGSAGRPR